MGILSTHRAYRHRVNETRTLPQIFKITQNNARAIPDFCISHHHINQVRLLAATHRLVAGGVNFSGFMGGNLQSEWQNRPEK